MAEAAKLVEQARALLHDQKGVSELRMFGGDAFLLNGHMFFSVSKRGLMLRVGKDAYAEALHKPGAAPILMRGRTMEGYVRVDTAALDDGALAEWLRQCLDFARTLPAKPSRTAPKPARKPAR